MPTLTEDATLDTLMASLIAAVTAADLADQALQGAVENVAELRQDRMQKALVARVAAQALYDEVFAGPALDEDTRAAFSRIIDPTLRDQLGPDMLADQVRMAVQEAIDDSLAQA
jgi:DNA-binding protein YbaB